jgi:hypothetical protein
MVQETQYGTGALMSELCRLLDNRDARAELEKNIKSFAVSDANEVIYAEIMRTVKEKSSKK